jgi:hypothetical protein
MQDQDKNKMTRGIHLKQVDNEACNNAKSCKMITMLSFKISKFVGEKEEHWGTQIKT